MVYVKLQNSGSASSIFTNVSITIQNDVLEESTIIGNAELVVEELPILLYVNSSINIAISFDPKSYVSSGENIIKVSFTYGEDLIAIAPENMSFTCLIQPLDLTVLNPINDSWVKGIIDPQAIVTGGYIPSSVTYDFILPNQTIELDDVALASNIDSTDFDDDIGYKMIFSVSDYLNQSCAVTNSFNIDNKAIGVTLSINDTEINQGDTLRVSWEWDDLGGAPVINQTLVLSGDIYGSESIFTALDDSVSSYTILGTKTIDIAEDD
ncbi:MAG: hypothetical protein ACTSQF_16330, partial [Candidatus Heimdallarchaeaceae archaeon]